MKQQLTEAEIDDLVIAEADDNMAWDEPITVVRDGASALTIPADVAARAAFLAKLHREENLEAWLVRVITERIELEEGAFLQAKRELSIP